MSILFCYEVVLVHAEWIVREVGRIGNISVGIAWEPLELLSLTVSCY